MTADQRPQPEKNQANAAKYLDLVPETNILEALEDQEYHIWRCLDQFRNNSTYRYAPNKWSVNEVLGHLVDTERTIGHQLLYIIRKDSTVLPRHNQDSWVTNSNFDHTEIEDLMTEFTALRTANLCLLKRLKPDEWHQTTTTGHTYSIHTLASILVGHIRHHLKIMNERYIIL